MCGKSSSGEWTSATLEERLRETLVDILGLDARVAASMDTQTPLFGALPELDSMSVATLLTEIEDRFDIVIDDQDVDGETFETFGSLSLFVADKIAQSFGSGRQPH